MKYFSGRLSNGNKEVSFKPALRSLCEKSRQEKNSVAVVNGPYANLFKIINLKGAGGQCAPYIAVMTISEFEPHSRFHS